VNIGRGGVRYFLGMVDRFDGFPPDGLQFLQHLGGRDKAWFDTNRATYTAAVAEPAKAFVAALGERLQTDVSADLVALPKANGSIAPINNDLRFAPDKSPYKDHLLLKFWEGANKKVAPTLYVRLSASEVGYATGAMLSDLDRWRELIDDAATGGALVDAIDALRQGRELDVAGEAYKQVPKPYPQDHPRAALLRHKTFQARWSEPVPSSVHDAAFVDHCVERLQLCAPIHRWLVTHL